MAIGLDMVCVLMLLSIIALILFLDKDSLLDERSNLKREMNSMLDNLYNTKANGRIIKWGIRIANIILYTLLFILVYRGLDWIKTIM